jgi:hypothetical protein
VVRVGINTSAILTLKGFVLSPLLYSLFTQDCMAAHDSNTIVKFAEDTMTRRQVKNLVYREEVIELAYREEVRDLAVWCQYNNLSLNVGKTEETTKKGGQNIPSFTSTVRWYCGSRSSSSSVSTSTTYHGPNTATES